MLEQKLKAGELVYFSNQNWCEENQNDDVRGGWVSLSKFDGYNIHFNGAVIGNYKTIKGLKNRLDKLMGFWKCEFISSEEAFLNDVL